MCIFSEQVKLVLSWHRVEKLKIATRHAVIVLASFGHVIKLEPASSLEQISYFDFGLY